MESRDSAIVLHTRRFRENSRIVELFTEQHGRIAALARISGKSASASRFQPFTELQTGWSGRGELKTLKSPEIIRQWALQGRASVCGLYLNELLLYLLDKELPSPELYEHYRIALSGLAGNDSLAYTLRVFEKELLDELGYLPSLHWEHEDGRCFFSPSQGLGNQSFPDSFPVSRDALEALMSGDLNQQSVAKEIKMILSSCIDRLLDGRPLRSRELIRSMSQK